MNRRERYPANSIVGDSKDAKEGTVPIIIIIIIIVIIITIIIIINDLKWNVLDYLYNIQLSSEGKVISRENS